MTIVMSWNTVLILQREWDVRLAHHGFIMEQSRKAKAAKSVYDYLKQRAKGAPVADVEWETIHGTEGVLVSAVDKHRVLNIRLQEEHLSPYFKTDMNLFHMLMLDDSATMTLYKGDHGWLLVFEGIPEGPQPFGQDGFDTR
jgi:hypothetical protein